MKNALKPHFTLPAQHQIASKIYGIMIKTGQRLEAGGNHKLNFKAGDSRIHCQRNSGMNTTLHFSFSDVLLNEECGSHDFRIIVMYASLNQK